MTIQDPLPPFTPSHQAVPSHLPPGQTSGVEALIGDLAAQSLHTLGQQIDYCVANRPLGEQPLQQVLPPFTCLTATQARDPQAQPVAHPWLETLQSSLPQHRQQLAEDYWQVKHERGNHAGLKIFMELDGALSQAFDEAMAKNDLEAFKKLFNDLSFHDIWDIYNAEQLDFPVGYVRTEPYEITQQDSDGLKQYLDDIGFSGVVYLSDADHTYTPDCDLISLIEIFKQFSCVWA